jgi:hypothetical protein
MGRAEAGVKGRLSGYGLRIPWLRNGSVTIAREVFRCSYKAAFEAFELEVGGSG